MNTNTSQTNPTTNPHQPATSRNPHNSHPSHSSHPSVPPVPVVPPVVPLVPPPNTPKTGLVPLVPPNFFPVSTTRRDDRLANLPREDRQTIAHWLNTGLTFRKIIHRAAQPRPEGLDLKISLGALSRFYHKHDLPEKIGDAARLIQEICPQTAANPEAALQLLAQTHALHTMASPDADHAAFQQTTRYLLRQEDQRIRHRALDLHHKRLAFDMQHKHYDIFKRTIEKLNEINQIVQDEALSPRERIHRHFVEAFGGSVADMVESANKKYGQDHPDERPAEPDIDPQDLRPPFTKEQQQIEDARALDVMFGIDPDTGKPFDDNAPNPQP